MFCILKFFVFVYESIIKRKKPAVDKLLVYGTRVIKFLALVGNVQLVNVENGVESYRI